MPGRKTNVSGRWASGTCRRALKKSDRLERTEGTHGTDSSEESSLKVDTAVTSSLGNVLIHYASSWEWTVPPLDNVAAPNAGCGMVTDMDVSVDVSHVGKTVGVVSDAIDLELSLVDYWSRNVLNSPTMLYALGGPLSLEMSEKTAGSPVDNSEWHPVG